MPNRFNAGNHCGCCGVCFIAEDNFNRANSTNLGADWDEELGDWEILNNELFIDEIGRVRNVNFNSFGSNSQDVTVKLMNYQDDTKYRILLQMNDTGTEYYFAEWHYVDANTMYWRVGDETATCVTIGPDTPIPEGTAVRALINSKNQLCMDDEASRISICVEPKPKTTHKWAGLGAATSVGATFDDYYAQGTTAESVECASCDCTCQAWCIPNRLIATFVELNECPDLDGLTIELENASNIKSGAGWVQTAVFNCPDATYQWDLVYNCAGEDFGSLNVIDSPLGNLGSVSADPAASMCHPLSLRFGPFSLGSVSGCGKTDCCGGYPCGLTAEDASLVYIWITADGDYDC